MYKTKEEHTLINAFMLGPVAKWEEDLCICSLNTGVKKIASAEIRTLCDWLSLWLKDKLRSRFPEWKNTHLQNNLLSETRFWYRQLGYCFAPPGLVCLCPCPPSGLPVLSVFVPGNSTRVNICLLLVIISIKGFNGCLWVRCTYGLTCLRVCPKLDIWRLYLLKMLHITSIRCFSSSCVIWQNRSRSDIEPALVHYLWTEGTVIKSFKSFSPTWWQVFRVFSILSLICWPSMLILKYSSSSRVCVSADLVSLFNICTQEQEKQHSGGFSRHYSLPNEENAFVVEKSGLILCLLFFFFCADVLVVLNEVEQIFMLPRQPDQFLLHLVERRKQRITNATKPNKIAFSTLLVGHVQE